MSPDVLAIHHHDLLDEVWGARVVDDQLKARGEIDISNADRLFHVLCAALDHGVAVVDLSGLTFAAAAGVRAFAEAVESVAPERELVLVEVDPALLRVFRLAGYDRHPRLRLVPRADGR